MDLLLIRHAEPIRIVDAEGPADPPLHDRGRVQAARLAAWLADEPLDAVWSSPMRRAVETAEPLAEAQGLGVRIDDELAEFDREATSYIPYEELKATRHPDFLAMVEGHLDDFSIDPVEFRARVVRAVEHVVAAHPGQRVAVVCHGGVINAYAGHVLGIETPLWFEPRYAGITRVAASRAGDRSIVTLNEFGHLRGLVT